MIELTIPPELWKEISYEDKRWLKDIARVKGWNAINGYHIIFNLENINKLRQLLNKYDYVITYPKSAVLRRFGLSHSGESLEIKSIGDAFQVIQYMPDGRVESVVIPKDIVWRVYYAIRNYLHTTGKKQLSSPEVWEILAKEFNLTKHIDRYGRFHKESFFGDRRRYFYFFYYPIKILDHIHKIEYRGKYISLGE